MCGFSIIVTRSRLKDGLRDTFLQSNKAAIMPRGPSFQQEHHFRNACVYQSVLSIQGEPSESDISKLLYNGEIYSWPERCEIANDSSESDTKILHTLLGIGKLRETLRDCDGMYAICAIRSTRDIITSLQATRDPAGEKHLWFYQDSSFFILSSTPSVVHDIVKDQGSDTLDKGVLADYMLRRHLISPKKHVIKGIAQILPGQTLSFDAWDWTLQEEQDIDISDWFDIETYHSSPKKVLSTESTLTSAIDKMLGVCSARTKQSAILSGGIDSSVTAYIANKLLSQKNFDLFTLVCGSKDPLALEAGKLLEHFGSNYSRTHTIIASTVSEYFTALIECLKILRSPINTHSIPSAFLVGRAAVARGNEVLYGGEGADELFHSSLVILLEIVQRIDTYHDFPNALS